MIQDINFYHPNPKIQNFYDGWSKRVGLVKAAQKICEGNNIIVKYAKVPPTGKLIPWEFIVSNSNKSCVTPEHFVIKQLADVAITMGFKQRAIGEFKYG